MKAKAFAALSDPVFRLRLALVLLPTLLVVGTIGYTLLGMNPFDGFYMTLITISTVGFSEVGQLGQSERVFTAFLIFSGVFLLAFSTASFLESLVEGELANYFGSLRLKEQITTLEDHWIICGFGRMGKLVASELEHDQRKMPFVIIDHDPKHVPEFVEHEYLYIQEDATHEETLEHAGIQRAKGLVSLVASDAENVFICLTARQMNPELIIVARSLEERNEAKLRHAGADKVISPYLVGGHRLSQAVLKPAVAEFLEFAASHDLNLELEESCVREGSKLVGVELKDSGLRRDLDLIVLAIRRAGGEMLFNPGAATRLELGDTLIAMGDGKSLVELDRRAGNSPVASS